MFLIFVMMKAKFTWVFCVSVVELSTGFQRSCLIGGVGVRIDNLCQPYCEGEKLCGL